MFKRLGGFCQSVRERLKAKSAFSQVPQQSVRERLKAKSAFSQVPQQSICQRDVESKVCLFTGTSTVYLSERGWRQSLPFHRYLNSLSERRWKQSLPFHRYLNSLSVRETLKAKSAFSQVPQQSICQREVEGKVCLFTGTSTVYLSERGWRQSLPFHRYLNSLSVRERLKAKSAFSQVPQQSICQRDVEGKVCLFTGTSTVYLSERGWRQSLPFHRYLNSLSVRERLKAKSAFSQVPQQSICQREVEGKVCLFTGTSTVYLSERGWRQSLPFHRYLNSLSLRERLKAKSAFSQVPQQSISQREVEGKVCLFTGTSTVYLSERRWKQSLPFHRYLNSLSLRERLKAKSAFSQVPQQSVRETLKAKSAFSQVPQQSICQRDVESKVCLFTGTSTVYLSERGWRQSLPFHRYLNSLSLRERLKAKSAFSQVPQQSICQREVEGKVCLFTGTSTVYLSERRWRQSLPFHRYLNSLSLRERLKAKSAFSQVPQQSICQREVEGKVCLFTGTSTVYLSERGWRQSLPFHRYLNSLSVRERLKAKSAFSQVPQQSICQRDVEGKVCLFTGTSTVYLSERRWKQSLPFHRYLNSLSLRERLKAKSAFSQVPQQSICQREVEGKVCLFTGTSTVYLSERGWRQSLPFHRYLNSLSVRERLKAKSAFSQVPQQSICQRDVESKVCLFTGTSTVYLSERRWKQSLPFHRYLNSLSVRETLKAKSAFSQVPQQSISQREVEGKVCLFTGTSTVYLSERGWRQSLPFHRYLNSLSLRERLKAKSAFSQVPQQSICQRDVESKVCLFTGTSTVYLSERGWRQSLPFHRYLNSLSVRERLKAKSAFSQVPQQSICQREVEGKVCLFTGTSTVYLSERGWRQSLPFHRYLNSLSVIERLKAKSAFSQVPQQSICQREVEGKVCLFTGTSTVYQSERGWRQSLPFHRYLNSLSLRERLKAKSAFSQVPQQSICQREVESKVCLFTGTSTVYLSERGWRQSLPFHRYLNSLSVRETLKAKSAFSQVPQQSICQRDVESKVCLFTGTSTVYLSERGWRQSLPFHRYLNSLSLRERLKAKSAFSQVPQQSICQREVEGKVCLFTGTSTVYLSERGWRQSLPFHRYLNSLSVRERLKAKSAFSQVPQQSICQRDVESKVCLFTGTSTVYLSERRWKQSLPFHRYLNSLSVRETLKAKSAFSQVPQQSICQREVEGKVCLFTGTSTVYLSERGWRQSLPFHRYLNSLSVRERLKAKSAFSQVPQQSICQRDVESKVCLFTGTSTVCQREVEGKVCLFTGTSTVYLSERRWKQSLPFHRYLNSLSVRERLKAKSAFSQVPQQSISQREVEGKVCLFTGTSTVYLSERGWRQSLPFHRYLNSLSLRERLKAKSAFSQVPQQSICQREVESKVCLFTGTSTVYLSERRWKQSLPFHRYLNSLSVRERLKAKSAFSQVPQQSICQRDVESKVCLFTGTSTVYLSERRWKQSLPFHRYLNSLSVRETLKARYAFSQGPESVSKKVKAKSAFSQSPPVHLEWCKIYN